MTNALRETAASSELMPSSIIRLSLRTPADGKFIAQTGTTTGSAVVTSVDGAFMAEDVGKVIRLASPADRVGMVSTIASFQGPGQVTLADIVATGSPTTGAVIGTDCGPAMQSAIDEITEMRGGILLIDGLFLWQTPVVKDFTTTEGVSLTLEGIGRDGGLLIAGSSTARMATFQNCPELLIRKLNFAGCLHATQDCQTLLDIQQSDFIIERNNLYGIAVLGANSVILAQRCRGRFFDNEYGSCIAESGQRGNIVDVRDFAFIDIARDRFLDYGTFQGALIIKTGIRFCYSWISIRNPQSNVANVNGGSVVRLTDVQADEGHFVGILIGADQGKTVRHVHLAGVRINNTQLSGGIALALERVEDAIIEQLSIGWSNTPQTGLLLRFCGDVDIDSPYITSNGVPGPGLPNELRASDVRNLTLRNAGAFARRSFTNVTRVREIIDGQGGVEPLIKGGRPTDADFISPPPFGTVAIDGFANRLYVKMPNGWMATPPLALSSDPTVALRNLTPATGTQSGANVYAKNSTAPSGWNTAAVVDSTLSGSFAMTVQPTSIGDMAAGAVAPTVSQPFAFQVVILGLFFQASGGLVIISNGSIFASGQTYAATDVLRLVWDLSAGTGRVRIFKNGSAQAIYDIGTPAGLNSDRQHKFGGSVLTPGSGFELSEYSRFNP